MSGNGQKALPGVREWSVVPARCMAMVWRPFRMSGGCREAFLDVREWSGAPHGCSGGLPRFPGEIGSHSRMSVRGRGREALPDVRGLLGGSL